MPQIKRRNLFKLLSAGAVWLGFPKFGQAEDSERILAVMLAFSGATAAHALEVDPWVVELHEAHEINGKPYRLLKPLDFDTAKTYPVIVSLHGGGGTGTDNLRQLRKWNQFLAEKGVRKEYPCYVLAPQTTEQWSGRHIRFQQI